MIHKLLTEFLGTFLVCFVYLTTHNYLASGIAVSLAYFLFKGSNNPAIAFSRLLNKEISTQILVITLIAEFAAVIAASFASKIVFSS